MEIHSSIDSSEELMHYGRKGMKWYQNIFSKDKGGSGRKKGKSNDDDSDESKSKSSPSSSSSGKKSAKDMSEAELMSAIRHLQLEKQYRDLEAQNAAELDPPKTSKGKEFVGDFVKKAAVPAIQEAGKSLAKDWLIKVGKEALGLEQLDEMGALEKEVKKLRLTKETAEITDFLKKRNSGEKTAEEREKEYVENLKNEVNKRRLEKSLKDLKAEEAKENAKKNTETKTASETSSKKTESDADRNTSSSSKSETSRATGKSDNRTVKEKWNSDTSPIIDVNSDPLSSTHVRTAASKGLSVTSNLMQNTGSLSINNAQVQNLSDAGKGYMNELRQWYSKAH